MRYRHERYIRPQDRSRVNIPNVHPFVREQLEYVEALARATSRLWPDTDHARFVDIAAECEAIIANVEAHSRNPMVASHIRYTTRPLVEQVVWAARDDIAAAYARDRAAGLLTPDRAAVDSSY